MLGEIQAPVCASVMLPDRLRRAAADGRLLVRENTADSSKSLKPPVQIRSAPAGEKTRLCWLMSPGPKGRRLFTFETTSQQSLRMFAEEQRGQYVITEQSKPVLRYNYSTVEPGDLLKSVSAENRKYAVARSDYIHPLYGPSEEELTKDWSVDHPHHRGIYWAWPEVDWKGQRGDLHALQRVFARPSGRCEALSGPVFAQLLADNVWLWEDREPIVRERATIRAYAGNGTGRIVDLEFNFEAVGSPLLLARRGTTHYGGLNVRLSTVKNQQITKHGNPAGVEPPKAWADLSGTFADATAPAGLTICQIASNPDYPGDWIEYPELNWLQPTFPASGTRYEIKQGKPLILRFRLWAHAEGTPSELTANHHWVAANCRFSPLS